MDNSNTNRLVNNTLALYLRTILIMGIGLFTSRVILQCLGVDDFGIYNVVGGFVGMFSVITQSLVVTTQRFITVELGKGNDGSLKDVFGSILSIHIGLVVLMVIVFETIGLYLFNHKLDIPSDRLNAANWVFQISVFTSVLGLFSTPYIGAIVAYERLRAFAFISLQDAILRLIICYALYMSSYDKLILYAILLGCISVWDQFLYMRYCFKNFNVASTKPGYSKNVCRSIFSFAGLNFSGSLAYILSTEGLTILLNMFFGVVVNAARGIAQQVNNMVSRFTNDFMTALNPQITKEYSSGNGYRSMQLGCRGAKMSFFIVLILALPIVIRTDSVLKLWLGSYPEYTTDFVRLTFIMSVISVLSYPFVTIILAVGRLKGVTLWLTGTKLMTLPLAYGCFKLWHSPLYAYYVVIFLDFIIMFVRLQILKMQTGLDFPKNMITKVLFPIIYVSGICSIISIGINLWLDESFIYFIIFFVLSALSSFSIIYLIGLNAGEKEYVKCFIRKIIHKINF